MKRNLFFIAIILITAVSCVKDRTIPTAGPVVAASGDTLVYYWSFSSSKLDSSVRKPDFTAKGAGAATFNYNAAYIDYTGGANVNLIGTTDSSQCLRVRNPSNYLIFTLPTTGFDSVVFSFAEEASSTTSGSTINALSYTTDGVNYTTPAGSQYNVTTSFTLQKFSFFSDPAVKNNPNFAIKITFANNNTGTSGNDRFDNIALLGVRM